MSQKNIVLFLLQISTESRTLSILIQLYHPVIFFSILGVQTFEIIYFFQV